MKISDWLSNPDFLQVIARESEGHREACGQEQRLLIFEDDPESTHIKCRCGYFCYVVGAIMSAEPQSELEAGQPGR